MDTQQAAQGPQKATHPWKSTTHEERFYHFHDYGTLIRKNKNEEINAAVANVARTLSGTKFSHVTVFARKEMVEIGDGKKECWFFSLALRARNDPQPFSRKVGRSVARRKYFAEAYHRRPLGETCDHTTLVQRVIEMVQTYNHPPMHAKPYPGR